MVAAVTVVLAHDDRALRISAALGKSPSLLSTFDMFDAAQLPELLMDVAASTPIIVVHVLGDEASGADLLDQLRSTHGSIMAVVPGARALRQWVLQLAGVTWEVSERQTALSALEAGRAAAMSGVLVTARSSAAFLHQRDEEELVTARDALHCLVHSAELERQLSERARVLLVGTTSVTYDPGLSHSAARRHRVTAVLEQLLVEPSATATDRGAGREWLKELSLEDKDEQTRMLSGPDSGSLLTPLAISRTVYARALDDVAISDWPAVVGAAVEELRGIRVRRALDDLAKGAEQRHEELARRLDSAVLAAWESSASIGLTELYVTGMVDALAEVRTQLASERPDTLAPDPGPLLERLRRYARHFPFPAAVGLRFALLAAAAMLLVAGPLARVLTLTSAHERLAARLAAAGVVLLGAFVLQTRWRRLLRARDAALKAAQTAAEMAVVRAALDARQHMLTALMALLGAWTERLAVLRAMAEESCSALADSVGEHLPSRMSLHLAVEAPATETVPRGDDLQTIVNGLRDERLVVATAPPLIETLQPLLDTQTAETPTELGAFLAHSVTAKEGAVEMLSIDAVPVVGDMYAELQVGQVRRILCLPGGLEGETAQLTLDALSISHDAVLGMGDTNFAAMFHFLEADFDAAPDEES